MKARKGGERRISRSPVINKRKDRDSRSPAVNKRRDRDSRSPFNSKRPERKERDGNKRMDDDKKKRDPKVLDIQSSSKKDDKDELRALDDINAKSKRSKNGNMDNKKNDNELICKELDDEIKEAGTKQSKKIGRSLSRTPSPFLKQHERPNVSVKNSSSANNGNSKSSHHSSNAKKMDKVLQTKARSSSCEEVPMTVVDNKKSSAAKDNIGRKELAEHVDDTTRSNSNKNTGEDAGGKVINKKSSHTVSDSKVKQTDVVKRTHVVRDQSDSDQMQKSKNNNSDQSEEETDSEAELKKRKKHAKKHRLAAGECPREGGKGELGTRCAT